MTDLDKLIEAVEAGHLPTFPISWRALGDAHVFTAEEAFDGSLDAAKRLHDALLPGWRWNAWAIGGATVWMDVRNTFTADNTDPARAWLLAILRAVKSLPGNGASNATAARPGSGDA